VFVDEGVPTGGGARSMVLVMVGGPLPVTGVAVTADAEVVVDIVELVVVAELAVA
jgi:hypothetical protein